MKTIANWLVRSSADPKRVSLTIRASLLMVVPMVMHALSLACGFGVTCFNVEELALNQIVESLAHAVELILWAVAGILALFGLVRKLVLTALGRQA